MEAGVKTKRTKGISDGTETNAGRIGRAETLSVTVLSLISTGLFSAFEAGELGECDVQGVADGFFKLHDIFVRYGRLKPELAAVVRGGVDRGRDSEEQSEGGVACGICHGKGFLSEVLFI